MASGGGGGSFATIKDVPDNWTTEDELQALDKLNAKEKKVKEKLQKEEPEGGKDYKAMWEYAHFICARSNTVIPRDDLGRIQSHKERCPFCIEVREMQKQEKQTRYDALENMRIALIRMERAKSEIEYVEGKIREERSLKRENWQEAIKYHWQLRLDNAKADLHGWLKQKHALLNHDNETTRNAALEIFQQYLDSSEKDRRSGRWWQPRLPKRSIDEILHSAEESIRDRQQQRGSP
jgi:hypothetical protein